MKRILLTSLACLFAFTASAAFPWISGGGRGVGNLTNLLDVRTNVLATIADGDAIVWNATLGKWSNSPPAAVTNNASTNLAALYVTNGAQLRSKVYFNTNIYLGGVEGEIGGRNWTNLLYTNGVVTIGTNVEIHQNQFLNVSSIGNENFGIATFQAGPLSPIENINAQGYAVLASDGMVAIDFQGHLVSLGTKDSLSAIDENMVMIGNEWCYSTNTYFCTMLNGMSNTMGFLNNGLGWPRIAHSVLIGGMLNNISASNSFILGSWNNIPDTNKPGIAIGYHISNQVAHSVVLGVLTNKVSIEPTLTRFPASVVFSNGIVIATNKSIQFVDSAVMNFDNDVLILSDSLSSTNILGIKFGPVGSLDPFIKVGASDVLGMRPLILRDSSDSLYNALVAGSVTFENITNTGYIKLYGPNGQLAISTWPLTSDINEFWSNSVAIGWGAVSNSLLNYDSVVIGTEAGYGITNSQYANLIGYRVGYNTGTAQGANISGWYAGSVSSNSDWSVVQGFQAGRYAREMRNSVILGADAGANSIYPTNAVLIGYRVGYAGNDYCTNNNPVFIGYLAGEGAAAGEVSKQDANCMFIGYQASRHSDAVTHLTNATALGYQAKVAVNNGFVLGNSQNLVGIGTNAPGAKLDVNGSTILNGTLAIGGNDADVGFVWTCTDAGTGAGHWATAGAASQTPWGSDINAATYALTNVGRQVINASVTDIVPLTINGEPSGHTGNLLEIKSGNPLADVVVVDASGVMTLTKIIAPSVDATSYLSTNAIFSGHLTVTSNLLVDGDMSVNSLSIDGITNGPAVFATHGGVAILTNGNLQTGSLVLSNLDSSGIKFPLTTGIASNVGNIFFTTVTNEPFVIANDTNIYSFAITSGSDCTISVTTNTWIAAITGGNTASAISFSLLFTNGTGTSRPLVFQQTNNVWKWSYAQGATAPTTLTNNTQLLVSGRMQGTNILAAYAYYQWP